MRTRNDSKRAVVLVAVVKVQPDGQHLIQNLGRWLDKDLTFLVRPSQTLRRLDTLRNRDAQILMKSEKPIARRRLDKEGALHSDGTFRQNRTYLLIARDVPGELSAPRDIDQSTSTGPPSAQAPCQP